MRKRIVFLMVIFSLLSLAGCNKGAFTETDYSAAIMVDGKIYLKTVESRPGEVDESAIIGYFQSYTDTYPKKDGQTNISKDLIDAPYAKVEGGIAILYQNEWYLCIPDDTETISFYDNDKYDADDFIGKTSLEITSEFGSFDCTTMPVNADKGLRKKNFSLFFAQKQETILKTL